MAGFFGFFDYTKEGPGVPENMPPKSASKIFFEIFFRKFWNLVKLNIMYFLFNIPAFAAALYITSIFFQKKINGDLLTDLVIRLIFASVFVCLSLITLGPVQAGFTYILRNYSREEHAFIWWDFKDCAIKNMKESLLICSIDFIAVFLIGLDLNICINFDNGSLLMSVSKWLLILTLLIFLMMHIYIYPLLVTFKLSVKHIYKNAFIFAFLRFLPNFLIIMLCLGIVLITFLLNFLIGLIMLPLITMSLIGLIINFFAYPTLKKYMMDRGEILSI